MKAIADFELDEPVVEHKGTILSIAHEATNNA